MRLRLALVKEAEVAPRLEAEGTISAAEQVVLKLSPRRLLRVVTKLLRLLVTTGGVRIISLNLMIQNGAG